MLNKSIKTGIRQRKPWAKLTVLLFSMLAVIVMLALTSCSDNNTDTETFTWNLKDAVLTIYGSGKMDDYSVDTPSPWHDQREAITSVNISDGITYIGSYAFNECKNKSLENVTIENSETNVTLGEYVFPDSTVVKFK